MPNTNTETTAKSGLGSFLAPIGSALINSAMSYFQEKRQRKWQLEDERRQNLYNSPKAQISRLKEAGLNPNLVYGSGSGGGIMPSATPERAKVNYNPIDIANIQLLREQIKSVRLDNELKGLDITDKDMDIGLKQKTINGSVTTTFNDGAGEEIIETPYIDWLANKQREAGFINAEQNIEDQKNRTFIRKSSNAMTTIEMAKANALVDKEIQTFNNMKVDERKKIVEETILNFESKIKKAEEELSQKGIFKSDPLFDREMMKYLENSEGYVGFKIANMLLDQFTGGIFGLVRGTGRAPKSMPQKVTKPKSNKNFNYKAKNITIKHK